MGAVAGGAIDAFVKSIAEGVESVLKTLSTVWMTIPSPDVQGSGAVASITADLKWYTGVFALVGVLVALGRTGVEMRAQPALRAVHMLVTLIVVTGCGAVVVGTLIEAGDRFAPWIIDRATGQQFSTGAASILTAELLTGRGQGLGLVIGVLALLGSVVQIMFMIVRSAMILVLMALLPTLAASSATEGGAASFRKAVAWLGAFVLYKPIAAIIYAFGFLLLKGNTATTGGGNSDVMSLFTGLTVIVLAALTLPALIKFLVPVTAPGTSSAFSGAAALGVMATGAAVVAAGGAGLAARGGGAAARGAGTSGGGDAAPAAGGATPSPGGGSSSGGGRGPAPTGGGSGGGVPAPAGANPDQGGGGGAASTAGGPAGLGAGTSGGGPADGAAASNPSSSSTPTTGGRSRNASPADVPSSDAGSPGGPSGAGPTAGGSAAAAAAAAAASGTAARADRVIDDDASGSGPSGTPVGR